MTTEDKDKSHSVNLFKLLKYANFADKVTIIIGSIAAIVGGFGWTLVTVLFGDLVDVFIEYEKSRYFNNTSNLTTDEFLDEAYFLGASLFVWGILFFIFNYLTVACFSMAATNQIFTIRSKYLKSVLKQEIAWFDSRPAGDFASRVTVDLKRIEDGIGDKMGLFLFHFSSALIAIIYAFSYGWLLTLVVLSISPVLAASTSIMAKVQMTFARKESESYASAGAVAEEVISSIRTVYAFCGEQKEVKRYENNLYPAMNSGIRRNFITGVGTGIMWACIYGGFALGIWFGVKLIIWSREDNSDLYSIGTVMIVFWNVMGCGWNMGSAAPHFEAIQMARGSAAQVFDTIERQPVIDSSSHNGDKVKNLETDIEFRDVHFSYPSRSQIKVLDAFSLTIKPGETIALVGQSGCGKSTLIQLIQRFYDPQKGRILIGGNDIKWLNVGWLREQLGVVGQEPILFDTTIAENISLGSHKRFLNFKDIELSAHEANAHEFISKLPEDYQTYVGDRGTQLSGGQKQRIAIARALIKKPKILLLDEATSALDLHSEAVVQLALERASKGRTTIIVAHRLSTVINSNRIAFIENGKVKELGSHKELMLLKGSYYELVRAQQTLANDQNSNVIDNCERLLFDRKDSIQSYTVSSDMTKEDDDEQSKEALKQFTQMRLFRMLAVDKIYIIIGLLCSLLYGLVIPVYSLIFGELIESFAIYDDNDTLRDQSIKYALYYLALASGVGLVSVIQITMLGIAGERLTLRLRKMAFEAMLRQDISWFDKSENSTGSLCARLATDASNVQGATGSRMSVICQALSTLIASAIYGFSLNWKLSALMIAFVPFVIAGTMIAMAIVSSQLSGDKVAVEKGTKTAIEAIASIRTVASLHREQYFIDKYCGYLFKQLKSAQKKCHFRGLSLGFAQSIVFHAYATAFIFGAILLSRKELTSGDFFKIIETMLYGAMVVGQSSVFTSDYQKAKLAAANIFALVDSRPIIDDYNYNNANSCDGKVVFRDVSFTYPNRPDAHVLRGLSFCANRGQTIALVGSSGCGKSTSIQLLERFYDCTEGFITIDGIEINSLSKQWLRSQMALVSQEPTLFSYSIGDNIAYGDNSRFVDMDTIISAAIKANIHDFIRDLPHGYDTQVGNKGTQLSGGQKQRIAIARALVRDPKILLLDEATSALDSASEKAVQEALDEACDGRTCIVIAHRLTTIHNADNIVVIHKGIAVEEGTHEQLMRMKTFYFNLYNIQSN